MNKLILIPLTFMLMVTIFSFTYTGVHPQSDVTQNLTPGTIIIEGNNTTIGIPGGELESQGFDIWLIVGAFAILGVAIAAGIASGITALGSGLSDSAQGIIFNSLLWLGLWAALSYASSAILFGGEILFSILWLILTLLYVIGFASEINGSGADV